MWRNHATLANPTTSSDSGDLHEWHTYAIRAQLSQCVGFISREPTRKRYPDSRTG
ncbi:MAG: hypothetical protein JOZ39_12700 [Chloroflexi bacterium]|nr:hypothetical protein [Chloroflexota bacterium]